MSDEINPTPNDAPNLLPIHLVNRTTRERRIITLTPEQVRDLPTVPVPIIPAPGPGKRICATMLDDGTIEWDEIDA